MLMALIMGSRSAFGLFVSPLNSASGIGLAGLAFAIALGQLAQGLAQPVLGALADRYGTQRLIRCGALVLAPATLAVTVADGPLAMCAAMAVMAFASSAVGSNNLLIAEVGRRVPLERHALAFGIVSAGGSAGQMLFGPATQGLIDMHGWIFALGATALMGLLAWPLARGFGSETGVAAAHAPAGTKVESNALRSTAFWLIAGSYAVCGFHVGYLTTHMPGVIERCGLPASLAGIWLAVLGFANIAGSLSVAWWLRRASSRDVLMGIFGLRGASVALLLVLPPSTELMLGFAVLMGLTYMALLPAISQQVAERFGMERMATLFGIVSLVHQVGSFGGVWLGGVVAATMGSDALMWSIDIGLALTAIALQWRLGWGPAPRTRMQLRSA
jgi:predicted MFS family arabinose efflux permease